MKHIAFEYQKTFSAENFTNYTTNRNDRFSNFYLKIARSLLSKWKSTILKIQDQGLWRYNLQVFGNVSVNWTEVSRYSSIYFSIIIHVFTALLFHKMRHAVERGGNAGESNKWRGRGNLPRDHYRTSSACPSEWSSLP